MNDLKCGYCFTRTGNHEAWCFPFVPSEPTKIEEPCPPTQRAPVPAYYWAEHIESGKPPHPRARLDGTLYPYWAES